LAYRTYAQLQEFEREGETRIAQTLKEEFELQSRLSDAVFGLLQRWVENPELPPGLQLQPDEFAVITQCIQAFNSLEAARVLLLNGYTRQIRVMLRHALEQVSLAVYFVYSPKDAIAWIDGKQIRPAQIGKLLKKEKRYDELQNLYAILSEPVHANWGGVDNLYLQSGALSVAIGPQFSSVFLFREWIVYMSVALVVTSMCIDSASAYLDNEVVINSLKEVLSRVADVVNHNAQEIIEDAG